MSLYQTLAFTIHGKYKKVIYIYKKKIKMSAPTSNEEFELPDGYFVSKLRLK